MWNLKYNDKVNFESLEYLSFFGGGGGVIYVL